MDCRESIEILAAECRLPERTREALLLRVVDRLDVRGIAEVMRISEERVWGYLSEARGLICERGRQLLPETTIRTVDVIDATGRGESTREQAEALYEALSGPPRHAPQAPLTDSQGRRVASGARLYTIEDLEHLLEWGYLPREGPIPPRS